MQIVNTPDAPCTRGELERIECSNSLVWALEAFNDRDVCVNLLDAPRPPRPRKLRGRGYTKSPIKGGKRRRRRGA